MTFDRIAIIFNPNATGDAPAMAAKLREQLSEHGITAELTQTEHAGHAEELARNFCAQGGRCLVVSVSGDGGYNEVVNGMIDSGNPDAYAAVHAAGNANDHRTAIRERPLVESIIEGKVTELDLLEVTVEGKQRYAHSYVGLGISPVVALELNRHDLDRVKELWLVYQTYRKFKPFAIRIGDVEQVIDSLVIANIGRMAKFVKTGAHPGDGLFDLITVSHRSKLGFLFEALRYVTIGPRRSQQLREFRFASIKPMPMQLDGEVMELGAGQAVTVKIKPHGLRTLL
jgi:diacylglycerol kinase family enzyme